MSAIGFFNKKGAALAYDSISVSTNTPVAFDSPDHLVPWGTAQENSTNLRFNQKLIRLFPHLRRPLKVLDLGCSGGGFVKSLLEDGCFAVGVEGSDYSEKHARAEWPVLGRKFLFTADITRDFQVYGKSGEQSEAILFDVITAWEVMEHLPQERLDTVMKNLKKHLAPNGLIVMSISSLPDIVRGTQLHLTLKEKGWWKQLFMQHSFSHIEQLTSYFNTQFVRGPKQNAPGSFHLVLSFNEASFPMPPGLSWKEWAADCWLGSSPQRMLKKLIVGES